MNGRILIIGEHIANGGLGLHGDLITATALGGDPLSAVTAMSTTNIPLKRVSQAIDPEFVGEQVRACFQNPGVDSIKVGAMSSMETIDTISRILDEQTNKIPVVVNPVLVSDMGEAFLNEKAIDHFKRSLLMHASLFILNIRDAELFSGIEITNLESMEEAAKMLQTYGCGAVLVTGGLMEGDHLYDVLITDHSEDVLSMKKQHRHRAEGYRFGGGWVLATAIATSLGQDYSLMDAINRSRQFVDKAIGSSFNSDDNYQSLHLTHAIQPFSHDKANQPFTVIPGTRFRSFS